MTKGTYKYPMAITQQFRHCGNPFRLDAYKNCTFGCSYCFANNRTGGVTREDKVADVSIVEKMFFKAFETDKEYKNITIEMEKNVESLNLSISAGIVAYKLFN